MTGDCKCGYTGLSLHFLSKDTWTLSAVSYNNCHPPSIALSLRLLSQETSCVCSPSLLALKLLCSSLQNTNLILQSLSFQVLHTCKVLVGYSLMEENLFYLFPRKFCSASEKKRCPRCIFILLSIGLNQVPLSEAGPAIGTHLFFLQKILGHLCLLVS